MPKPPVGKFSFRDRKECECQEETSKTHGDQVFDIKGLIFHEFVPFKFSNVIGNTFKGTKSFSGQVYFALKLCFPTRYLGKRSCVYVFTKSRMPVLEQLLYVPDLYLRGLSFQIS
jgi:hypothetical protein